MKITAAIISFNEAENIRAACESVDWADEILCVDYGVEFLYTHAWRSPIF